jgi:hypothetical protein
MHSVTSILDHFMDVFQGKSCGGTIIYQQLNGDYDLLSKLRGSQEILKDFRKQNENGSQLSEDVLVMSLVSFKEVLHAGNVATNTKNIVLMTK